MLTFVELSEIYFFLPFEAEFSQGDEREDCCYNHRGEEMRVVGEMHRGELEGEEAFDEHPRQVDALDAEEATCQHDDGEGADYSRHPADAFVEFLEEELVGAYEDTLQGAVYDEVPRRAVPQTADEETEPQVEILAGFGLHAAAAQREVEVVLDEYAEGLVPTSPKL